MSALDKIMNKDFSVITAIEKCISFVATYKSGVKTAEEAAAELAALQERVEMLEAGVKLAQRKLRSATVNWQEQCFFDCDNILSALDTQEG